jgi:hypothetical protein
MTLTPSQIEVLARFDGWSISDKGWYSKGGVTFDNEVAPYKMQVHLTSSGVLIEMRLKVLKQFQKMEGMYGEEVKFNEEVTDLILSGEYTAAAIKTSELIQKLEA